MSTTVIISDDVPTPDELAETMRMHSESSDKEMRHIAMDNALADTLEKLGYTEAIRIFHDTPKWHA